MPSITLDAAVIGPLRNALYSHIAIGVDALDAVLVLPDRERNPGVRDAYRALLAAGSLLDAIGWQEQHYKNTLTINTASQARMILNALEVEWGVEREQVETLRRFGQPQSVAEAQQRCAAVRDVAHTVETAASAAGLLDGERWTRAGEPVSAEIGDTGGDA
ncbi:MAG: hypothetical protein ACYCU0_08010 [Solirubrobacteraceae bacterium]